MNDIDHADSIRRPVRRQHVSYELRLVVDKKVAADLLSVCVRQVENLLTAGLLQSLQCGRMTLSSVPSLESYVSARLIRRSKISTPFARQPGRDAA